MSTDRELLVCVDIAKQYLESCERPLDDTAAKFALVVVKMHEEWHATPDPRDARIAELEARIAAAEKACDEVENAASAFMQHVREALKGKAP